MDSMQVRREVWMAHVEAWRGSGLTQVGYCQQHGLNSKRLAYWIKRAKPMAEQSPLTLVPVTVAPSVAAGELLLRHASGWQLALPSSIEPAWLAGLLRGMV
jgi:hypothetical protein